MLASNLATGFAGGRSSTRFLVGMLLAIGLLAAAPSRANDAQDAQKLLFSMTNAIHALDYQGSFTYQHSGRTDTLRVFHAGGANERERLVSLNGPSRELVRTGSSVICVGPDGSAVSYAISRGKGLLPLVPTATTSSLDEHYDIRMAGSDRVAGYLADVIEVRPRDGFRYGYRIWLERDSHMLLRSMVVDQRQQVLEQFMFVALEIGRLPSDADLVPRRTGNLTADTSGEDEIELRKSPNFRVTDAPPGFALISARRPSQPSSATSEHLVFSDGLASVSVYIEAQADNPSELTTLAGRGTLNLQVFFRDGMRFTVLGDVPIATVGSIAGSIEQVRGNGAQKQIDQGK